MTSKISLRKLVRISAGQRSWLAIVMSAACAFLLPIALLMRVQSVSGWFGPLGPESAEMAAELLAFKRSAIMTICGSGNVFVWAGVIIAALLAAFSGYSYLQSRSKVDFYHSLAVRRGRLFFAPYIAGALLTIIPYVICQMVALFAVGGFAGALDAAVIQSGMLATGIFVLSFFAVYSVLILGMILSGRMVTGVLFGVFLIVYGPLCFALIKGLFSMSFLSYWETSGRAAGFVLSPATMIARLANAAETGAVPVWMILIQAIYAVAGVALSLLFYKGRPSEAAENALIHPRMHGVLKCVITVPAAILAGTIFNALTFETAWLFVGAILSAFLINWLLDAVFDRDVKGILAHKASGIVSLAATAAILFIFVADPFGYDRWVPASEKVEAMAMVRQSGESPLGIFYPNEEKGTREYLDAGMTGNFAYIYDLAKEGAESRRGDKEYGRVSELVPDDGETYAGEYVLFAYKMKSGSVKYRRHMVNTRRAKSVEAALSEDPSYREKAYPAAYLAPNDLIDCWLERMHVEPADAYIDDLRLALSQAERAELLDCLREDAEGCSLAELEESVPVAELYFNAYGDGGNSPLSCHMLYIYPQYTRTLKFLDKK